jgi:hypothetical protein
LFRSFWVRWKASKSNGLERFDLSASFAWTESHFDQMGIMRAFARAAQLAAQSRFGLVKCLRKFLKIWRTQ